MVAAVVLAAGLLTGCSSMSLGQSSSCVDWVVFDTPEDAAADADGVVIGRVVGEAGTTRLYDQDMNVWRVAVDSWVRGDGASEIDVASSPRTCEEGSPYPDGDPLDAAGDVMIFVRDVDGAFQTITGYQGVIPATTDGELPAEWPADPSD